MQLFTFAARYIKHPVNGMKIPVFDRRIIQAPNKEEAAMHSFILNRPAVLICELGRDYKDKWIDKLKKSVNANQN